MVVSHKRRFTKPAAGKSFKDIVRPISDQETQTLILAIPYFFEDKKQPIRLSVCGANSSGLPSIETLKRPISYINSTFT